MKSILFKIIKFTCKLTIELTESKKYNKNKNKIKKKKQQQRNKNQLFMDFSSS